MILPDCENIWPETRNTQFREGMNRACATQYCDVLSFSISINECIVYCLLPFATGLIKLLFYSYFLNTTTIDSHFVNFHS